MLITTQRMSEPMVEWVGSSCWRHGAYTFYKGFKLTANGETREYLLGDFYFIRNSKDRPICIAEFQLLWHDANTDNKLASARLYFRPESIPGGRQSTHGKDELLCTDEKVVIKCKDMMNIEYDGPGWSYGIKALSEQNLQEVSTTGNCNAEDTKKFRLLKRKSRTKKMAMPKERTKMVILSFPAYCRFKSLMKKLSNGLVLTKMAIKAFGGVLQCNDCTWVSFSRESFHHPGLAKFEMFMHNKAPVLKGRPRKKKVGKSTTLKEEIKEQQNVGVEEEVRNEAESSDDNNTDTSDESSIQELPCPPKLVSGVKEEKQSGVIRCAKEDSKPATIPPVPKLVKIEVKEAAAYSRSSQPDVMYTAQMSAHKVEKNKPLKMSYPRSVITSSKCRDDELTDRVSFTPQTREECILVDDVPASIHAGLVSRAPAITVNHIQPRMSTIMSTTLATQGEVTQNLKTSDGNGIRAEQPLKRKRGRPSGGKSNKCLKSGEAKLLPKTVGDDQVLMKINDEYVSAECLMENADYSTEPQSPEERQFMKDLRSFMKKRGSPIVKVPALGFRKINLFKMYEATKALGGYDEVTSKRLWRHVYSEVGGTPSITSAATNSRKHYENLLLPFERYSKGEEYKLDVKRYDSPSPIPDGSAALHRDQNANVISQNQAVVLSTSQQDKLCQPAVTLQSIPTKTRTPTVSRLIQASQQDTRLKPTMTVAMSQHDISFKAAVTCARSQQDVRIKPVATVVMSHQEKRLKSSATFALSQQEISVKPAVAGMMKQPNELFKHTVSRGGTLSSQQNISKPARVTPQQDNVSYLTSLETQKKITMSHNERTSHHYAKPASLKSQQERRSVVYTQHQYVNVSDRDSPVEFVKTGNRSSPVMFCSSNSDKLSGRYPTYDSKSICHSTRPFPGTGASERVTTSESTRTAKKKYILDDYPEIYLHQHNSESRTSELEKKPKHIPRFDHVNDFSIPREYNVDESLDIRKHSRGDNDEILMTNKRAPSPHEVIYPVPVFQPTHYPAGAFEVYDLPSSRTFPVRASSRIFMPPHQVFPGPGHLAFSPYTPHIIATIDADSNTLYQLPIPEYYPQDCIPFPVDTGVQILHS